MSHDLGRVVGIPDNSVHSSGRAEIGIKWLGNTFDLVSSQLSSPQIMASGVPEYDGSFDITPADLRDMLSYVVSLARSAGDLILEGSETILASGTVDEKKNSVDLVTEYDVKVEELVKQTLSKSYPTFKL